MTILLLLGALGTAVVVLPGFGVRSLLRRDRRDAIDELELAIGTTVMVTTVIGVALIGFRSFSATRIAVPVVLLSLVGIPRAIRWGIPLLARPAAYVLSALALPWVWSALRTGYPPAGLFQWYYWDLGRALSRVHGIPTYVTEYGQHVRWLPDYLVFNVVAEAYRGAARFGSAADQLSAFRIPMAVLGIATIYGLLRLWLRSWTSLVGTGLLVATLAFSDKFNTFKPESFGIILGLVAVRLGVQAVRRREPALLLFVGGVVGLNLGVHAIGAVIAGMLLVGAVVAELVTDADTRRRETIVALLVAGVLAVGVAGATGWALQGRVFVISDASRPTKTAGGGDPTFLFLERNAGKFGEIHPPSLGDELSDNLQMPWDGFDLTSGGGIALGVLTIAGIAVGLASGRRMLQQAVLTTVIFAVLLAAGVLYFAASYDTYVPRHTGLGRFVQYAPFVVAMLVTIAIESVALRLERVDALSRHRFAAAAGATVIVVGSTALAIVASVDRYEPQSALTAAGRRVLDHLDARARPGHAVLTNIGTRGIFEFWTGLEDPLEARQALIESPRFVERSTALLEDAHRFFTGTGAPDLADRLGVDWIVVASSPGVMGSGASYGSPPPNWTVAGFVPDRARDGVVILRREHPSAARRSTGPAEDRRTETSIVLLVALIGGAAAWVLLTRSRRAGGRQPGAGTGVEAPDAPVDAPEGVTTRYSR